MTVTKSGAGTQVLEGANSYNGPTYVNGGVLQANMFNTLSPNSAMNVGTITAGTLDTGGFAQTVSSLTMGSLGTLNLHAGDILTSSTTPSFAGTLNISGFSGSTATLIGGYSGYTSAYGTFGTVTINGSLIGSTSYSLAYLGNELDIIGSAAPFSGLATWVSTPALGSSSSWNTPGNWQDGAGQSGVPGVAPRPAGQDTATFSNSASVASITLDAPVNLKSLTFSTSSYTLSGGSLTLQSSSGLATVTVSSGTQTIESSTKLTLASTGASTTEMVIAELSELKINANIGEISGLPQLLSKDGPGTLVLSGTNNYSGGTLVNAGILAITSSTALPDGQSLTVGAGGTLIFDPSFGASPIQGASMVAGSPLAVNPVPEPGTLVLLVAGMAVGFGVRRVRRVRRV